MNNSDLKRLYNLVNSKQFKHRVQVNTELKEDALRTRRLQMGDKATKEHLYRLHLVSETTWAIADPHYDEILIYASNYIEAYVIQDELHKEGYDVDVVRFQRISRPF